MRISDEIREQIRKDYATGKYTYRALAAKYGISYTSIGRILIPEYEEREREKNRIRQRERTYDQPKAIYKMNVSFYAQDQPLVDKVKSVYNIQEYIKGLISSDIKKENS